MSSLPLHALHVSREWMMTWPWLLVDALIHFLMHLAWTAMPQKHKSRLRLEPDSSSPVHT
jgi:hypothetical protein